MTEITREQLRQFDGKAGRRAYVAYQGKVYDVTGSPSFDEGDHYGQHAAGEDLTEGMDMAPHGDDALGDFPVVGKLVG